MIMKRMIINLFIEIKNRLFLMIDSYPYSACMTEIMELLQSTFSKMEDIYYRHFLLPKLRSIYIIGS
jgi:hypothetical protein